MGWRLKALVNSNKNHTIKERDEHNIAVQLNTTYAGEEEKRKKHFQYTEWDLSMYGQCSDLEFTLTRWWWNTIIFNEVLTKFQLHFLEIVSMVVDW